MTVGPGYAKVFSLENGGDNLGAADWKQVGPTITGEANGDLFGHSVSLSDDAQTLAVGDPGANGKDGDDDVGRVSIYRMDDSESVWKQIGEGIEGEGAGDESGLSVSLSANGKTVAFSSFGADDNSGQVRVFAIVLTSTTSTVSVTSTACFLFFVEGVRCLTPSSFDVNIRLPVRAPRRHQD